MDNAEFDKMWSDDQKMSVMFSVFRDKSVNPLSWEQKMNFWQETIERYCEKNDLVIVLPSTLPTYFTRKGRTPQCLDVVIAEMKRYVYSDSFIHFLPILFSKFSTVKIYELFVNINYFFYYPPDTFIMF